MRITEIQFNPTQSIEFNEYKPTAVNKQEKKNTTTNADTNTVWQKDVLLNVLDMLENNKQLDDSNPLDKAEAAPIETFDEAIAELRKFKQQLFNNEAQYVHSNINVNDVLYLFKEN